MLTDQQAQEAADRYAQERSRFIKSFSEKMLWKDAYSRAFHAGAIWTLIQQKEKIKELETALIFDRERFYNYGKHIDSLLRELPGENVSTILRTENELEQMKKDLDELTKEVPVRYSPTEFIKVQKQYKEIRARWGLL